MQEAPSGKISDPQLISIGDFYYFLKPAMKKYIKSQKHGCCKQDVKDPSSFLRLHPLLRTWAASLTTPGQQVGDMSLSHFTNSHFTNSNHNTRNNAVFLIDNRQKAYMRVYSWGLYFSCTGQAQTHQRFMTVLQEGY